MLKIGALVTYRDRSNRIRQGLIDKTSSASGQMLFRVSDRWFTRDGLVAA